MDLMNQSLYKMFDVERWKSSNVWKVQFLISIVKKKINLLEAGVSVSRNRTRKLGLITMYIHFDSFKNLDLPNWQK